MQEGREGQEPQVGAGTQEGSGELSSLQSFTSARWLPAFPDPPVSHPPEAPGAPGLPERPDLSGAPGLTEPATLAEYVA